jgi:S-DNA-T family DNA segregation ATPase FtsK/SpoIIIE
MSFLSPTPHTRLNEAVGTILLLLSLAVWLCLLSYSPADPSWNTASGAVVTHNLLGRFGAKWADLLFQTFGISVFLLPIHIGLLGMKWVRSSFIEGLPYRVSGSLALWFCISAGCGLIPQHWLIGGTVRPSGLVGLVLANFLTTRFNFMGAAIITAAIGVIALYLATTFESAMLVRWFAGPIAKVQAAYARWQAARQERRAQAIENAKAKAAERVARRLDRRMASQAGSANPRRHTSVVPEDDRLHTEAVFQMQPVGSSNPDEPPFDMPGDEVKEAGEVDIPIRSLAYEAAPLRSEPARPVVPVIAPPEPVAAELSDPLPVEHASEAPPKRRRPYELPSTELLHEIPEGNGYDSFELKEVASKIKSKLEEFNVRGNVVQINPGPVVTTFEFKPEAGIKYSRITTLTEDLCLGLQAESVLIERLPGKSTVGIEVPNSRRELISLRAILESQEFQDSPSKMTIAIGKDINGRIKVATLETMPHLLIAGSTGSGKSVMLNAMIMSFLYKATPDQVRMIMVDPKRVELGIYEGIPHLLTPVITEPKKATNALRNAVLEMERRLKLLAAQGVRNIDQFNRKMAQLRAVPRGLFDDPGESEDLKPLPYVLILIDELADLMMLERANVEECITRLAQMARAVGMHLVLATQRPSVDVITGIIKANFPSRISFRVATRVDSRTVLDSMGAEHLLGKGDMLFLPPGSSRLTRVHGAYVTEAETNDVVEFWKKQATPEYDETFLMAPPSEEDSEEEEAEGFEGKQDPMYEEALRVVLEQGKASTSTLQRRLRLGYGRAARILDMMQRDGIIGPPDGSKPREVLKRSDWSREVESQLR